jgi:hypothetical protein
VRADRRIKHGPAAAGTNDAEAAWTLCEGTGQAHDHEKGMKDCVSHSLLLFTSVRA